MRDAHGRKWSVRLGGLAGSAVFRSGCDHGELESRGPRSARRTAGALPSRPTARARVGRHPAHPPSQRRHADSRRRVVRAGISGAAAGRGGIARPCRRDCSRAPRQGGPERHPRGDRARVPHGGAGLAAPGSSRSHRRHPGLRPAGLVGNGRGWKSGHRDLPGAWGVCRPHRRAALGRDAGSRHRAPRPPPGDSWHRVAARIREPALHIRPQHH